MKQIRPYQLTSWTEEHLIALAQVFNKGHNVNFAFFQAFNNLMKNMELGKFIKTFVCDIAVTFSDKNHKLLQSAVFINHYLAAMTIMNVPKLNL